jgi:activating signal cointegrator complex subunit 3
MEPPKKKTIQDYTRDRHFQREFNRAIKHRDLPQFFAPTSQPVEETKNVKILRKNEEVKSPEYFFPENKNLLLEYAANPFFSLYYSDDEHDISLFKQLKGKMKDMGIEFSHKKKIDESYVLVMMEFLTALAGKGYMYHEYQKGLEIFEQTFSKNFSLKAINDEAWIQFLKLFEGVIENYGKYIGNPYRGTAEFKLNLSKLPGARGKGGERTQPLPNEKWDTLSNCSATDPFTVAKKEEFQPEIDKEAALREFQATVVESLPAKPAEPLTISKEFFQKFGADLKKKNLSYLDSIVKVSGLLIDQTRTNDEIMEPILNELSNDFEAALFLIENRENFIVDLTKAMKQVEVSGKSKTKEKKYINVSSNITIRTKDKGTSRVAQTEKILEAVQMLGMNGTSEAAEDLQQMRQLIKERFEDKNEDYFDGDINFVDENPEMLTQKFGMRRKEVGLTIVFDVEPKQKANEYRETQRLKIRDIFPEHLWKVYDDSETLNALQSSIFDAVYNTDENILCCAPTGAGKTNVALISITRLLQRHVDPVSRKIRSDFKVVYLSPLKALAAEIVGKFTRKLEYLGVVVRECTGDISLSKSELTKTNVIVSTPEKWDVMTRKSEELNSVISLLIIDEIHLLDEVRGRVLESLVARTVRLIEAKQCRIRLLGLSATLPNYVDVARFLKVSKKGLFHFDESFRPVPLYKKFIGIKKPELAPRRTKENGEIIKTSQNRLEIMNDTCYQVLKENLRAKKQVLVFVHSRKETVGMAQYIINAATVAGELNLLIFENFKGDRLSRNFDNKDLRELTARGIGVHNAGIKRKDRSAVEKAFIDGSLSVVVCTATLAWGINMPCHTVIIKGTDFYEPGVGFRPISLLDVQQIFGRAGRPQFDKFGEAVLITKAEDLNYFISMLSHVKSIESHFKTFMLEALLAEIVLGNISSFPEALNFIRSTFFYVRYGKNPNFYGVKDIKDAEGSLINLILTALQELNDLKLARFDEKLNIVEPTELGRIASHYYVNCETMNTLCSYLRLYDVDGAAKFSDEIESKNIIGIIAQATEFEQLSSKPEEEAELKDLKKKFSWIEVDKQYTEIYQEKVKRSKQLSKDDNQKTMFDQLDKIVLLVYGYLYGHRYETYSLESDTMYITENGVRILRCLLEIALKENNAILSENVLVLIRQIENCVSEESHPLRMFCGDNYFGSVSAKKNQLSEMNRMSYLTDQACYRVEEYANSNRHGLGSFDIETLRENPNKLEALHLNAKSHNLMLKAIKAFPIVDFIFEAKPIAQTIIKITIRFKAKYEYSKIWHHRNEHFWVFVSDGPELLHHSQVSVPSETASLAPLDERARRQGQFTEVSFFVPVRDGNDTYYVKIMSDHFVDSDAHSEIDISSLKMKSEKMDYTSLLQLKPLRIRALRNNDFEALFPENIKYFNPIQTQLFWPLYHTDENILIGAPTGSGKTMMAELAIFRSFKNQPDKKVVYIAPYKALVKERLKDWKARFAGKLGKKVHELSGDHTPNFRSLLASDLLVTTPEKWDGVTRNWQSRAYVQSVSLLIFDEIHLLGQDRGAVLEIIVSRTNYIAAQTGHRTRMIGLSTAMANGRDVGEWFGVKPQFSFSFQPDVRPVPLEYHFKGFSEPNYCPRMNLMNKPAYHDLKKFATGAPALIFVSSRRQTRLTALDLISLSQSEFAMKSPWLRMTEDELLLVLTTVKDGVLKQTLTFGVGIHHAGLETTDREIVEHLFVTSKILVLVATSTLAWGVNFPAKLVIIKGTEYFDAPSRTWVDMQISDILQMAGRAGRPQFNEKGYVAVYVESSKKNFFRKYLNDPFPIESNLLPQLEEHINAEIASGSIKSKQDCIDFLTWTYFFRRLIRNPSFYHLASLDPPVIQKFLIGIVDDTIKKLVKHECVSQDEDQLEISSTFLGQIASSYYICPKTAFKLSKALKDTKTIVELLTLLSYTEEYSQIPVRHGEDELNAQLARSCPYRVEQNSLGSPNGKAFLLFQAFLSDAPLPIRDYITDTKLVIDSAFRIINAMIDISANNRLFKNCIHLIQIMQMFVQGCWLDQSPLVNLSNLTAEAVTELQSLGVEYLSQLIDITSLGQLPDLLKSLNSVKLNDTEIAEIAGEIKTVPDVVLDFSLFKYDSEKFEPIKNRSVQLRPGDEAFLEVKIGKKNPRCPPSVQVKRWNKEKEYAWWILVGDLEKNKLFALKRLNFTSKSVKTLQFDIDRVSGQANELVDVLFMSDSFIGLDQRHTFNIGQYWSPVRPQKNN